MDDKVIAVAERAGVLANRAMLIGLISVIGTVVGMVLPGYYAAFCGAGVEVLYETRTAAPGAEDR